MTDRQIGELLDTLKGIKTALELRNALVLVDAKDISEEEIEEYVNFLRDVAFHLEDE